MEAKNCDMVVGNLVGGEDGAFESDQNEVLLALRSGELIPVPRASKREVADRIFDEILKLRLAPLRYRWTLKRCGSIWSSTRTWGSKRFIAAPRQAEAMAPRARGTAIPDACRDRRPRAGDRDPVPDPRRHRRLPALRSARGAQQDRLRRRQ